MVKVKTLYVRGALTNADNKVLERLGEKDWVLSM